MINYSSNKNTNILNKNRKNIGVLIGSLSSHYQEGILRGACAMAKNLDYNIIAFSGGAINPPNPNASPRERIFDLVDTDFFDGLIIPISSHTRFLTPEELHKFLDKFSSIPVVNISGIFDNHINIISDFDYSFEKLIDHYITVHGYKRLAFFRGPKHHASSNRRTEIYKQKLKKHGIPFDEDLIVYGDLSETYAGKFVSEFFDKRQGSCDTILAMNDNTAIKIISELKNRNIKVPEDVAISGSMNLIDSIFSKPQLTTIHEPLFQLGVAAITALDDLMSGKEVPKKVLVPTKLIVRESCGCTSSVNKQVYYNNEYPTYKINAENQSNILQNLNSYCKKRLQSEFLSSADNKLELVLSTFEEAILLNEHDSFIKQLESQLKDSLKTNTAMLWFELATAIQHSTLEYCLANPQSTAYSKLMYRLNLLLSKTMSSALLYYQYETKTYLNILRDIGMSLNVYSKLNSLLEYSTGVLDSNDGLICIYDKTNLQDHKVQCILGIRDKSIVALTDDNSTFNEKQILPLGLKPFKDRYTLLLMPLSYKNEALGYFIVNYNEKKGSIYETIQANMSSALKNELQLRDLIEAEERFSDIAWSSSDWLWEINEKDEFTYCSSSVATVLGYTNSEMLGKAIGTISIPSSGNFIDRIHSRESLFDIEGYYQNKNRDVVYLSMSATPIMRDGVYSGYRGVFKNITEQKLQEEKIKKLAYYDILTGLPNRTMFQDNMDSIILDSEENKRKFAIIFLDIDRFKYINDSMGHNAGDILLQHVSDALKISINKKDVLARIGGDDFSIILSNVESELEVVVTIKKIIEKFTTSFTVDGQKIYVTMSFGIAMYPSDGTSSNSLLKNADIAMYRAKNKGRNHYIFYDKETEEKNVSRIKQEENLYSAIHNNDFILELQPQVDTFTGEIKGLEALVRIKSEEQGIIYPGSFIPLSEELGLIGKIDEWVMKEACKLLISWKKSGIDLVPISINLSPTELRNPYLANKYFIIANNYQVNPKFIQIELTENALIENEGTALKILTKFKKYGFTIALDDFGTGHSSLTSINLYPIDTIKIDQSFVKDSIVNPKSKAIISTIMHLAKCLNLKIVAEGVEESEQFELIKSLDCKLIQGYYFSKPRRVGVVEQMLLSGKRYTVHYEKNKY